MAQTLQRGIEFVADGLIARVTSLLHCVKDPCKVVGLRRLQRWELRV